MNYLEQVLNRRISELNLKKDRLILNSKELITKNNFDEYDLNNFGIDLTEIETRIDELEKLKKGLGLVPINDIAEEKEECIEGCA